MRMFLLGFLLLTATPIFADLQIINPKDKEITYQESLTVRGKTNRDREIIANGESLPTKKNGDFAGVINLKNGKNLLEISNGEDKAKVRILKLQTFPDVENYNGTKHWARAEIIYLATLKIVEGEPDGNFYPDKAVTRGEFSTWLVKAKGIPIQRPSQDVFYDVPREHWRAPYVKLVTERSYVMPYSSDKFGLDDPLTRKEAAEIATRAEGASVSEGIIPLFQDVARTDAGAAPIYAAQKSGLIVGLSKNVFVYDPDQTINRGSAVMMLSRFSEAQAGINDLFDFNSGYEQNTGGKVQATDK